MIEVTYLNHNSYAVVTPTAVLVFDYAKDSDRKLERVMARKPSVPVLFFATHHQRHFDTSIFELAQERRRTYVLSDDIFGDAVPEKGLSVAWMTGGDAIESIDGTERVEAFKAPGGGVSFAITFKDGSVIFYGGAGNDNAEEQKVMVDRVAEKVPEAKIAFLPKEYAQAFVEKVNVANVFALDADTCKADMPAHSTTKCYATDSIGKTVEIS